jgi:hypothetical protein
MGGYHIHALQAIPTPQSIRNIAAVSRHAILLVFLRRV